MKFSIEQQNESEDCAGVELRRPDRKTDRESSPCQEDKSPFDLTYNPEDHAIIEEFQLGSQIYSNLLSPCQVYEVFDKSGQKYVLKTINKEKLTDTSAAQARQECTIHRQMDHENIVKLLHYSETSSSFEIVMEHLDNASYFEKRIEECGAEPIEDEHMIKKYASDILKGLAYIHSCGIIHGDIKLANLAIDSSNGEDVVKIIDFGLSLLRNDKLEGKACMSQPMGTMGYMAPEIKGSNISVGPAIDMWAFGIVLYKLCVAYSPSQIRGYSYGKGPIPFNKRDWKKLNPNLQDLISRCLEADPEMRISAEEALQHEALR